MIRDRRHAHQHTDITEGIRAGDAALSSEPLGRDDVLGARMNSHRSLLQAVEQDLMDCALAAQRLPWQVGIPIHSWLV